MAAVPRGPGDPGQGSTGLPTSFLLLLSLLIAGAPMVVDTLLPALPAIEADLGATTAATQSVVAAVLLGLATGQIVAGTVSDILGRRPVLLGGLTIGLIASVATVLAPDLTVLVALRFVQGFGVAAGVVVTRAMVADLSTGVVAARSLATVQSWAILVPVAAPVTGGLIVAAFGWRGVLAGIALALASGLVITAWKVPETLPRENRSAAARRRQRSAVWQGVRSGRYPLLLVAHSANFGILMAYVAASPFLYREILGMSPVAYGFVAAALMALVGVGGLVSARLLRERTVHAVVVRGVILLVLASWTTLALALSPAPRWTILLSAAVGLFAFGSLVGPVSSQAVDTVRAGAGMGSALLGGAQFAVGGLVAPLSGLGGSTDPVPFAVVQAVASVVVVTAYTLAHRLGRPRLPGRV